MRLLVVLLKTFDAGAILLSVGDIVEAVEQAPLTQRLDFEVVDCAVGSGHCLLWEFHG